MNFLLRSSFNFIASCKNLNRKFIGIEIDKTYFELSQERINFESVNYDKKYGILF